MFVGKLQTLIELLKRYNLIKKIIVHVKDKGSNSNTMTNTLKKV
jgi:hypothetical protein